MPTSHTRSATDDVPAICVATICVVCLAALLWTEPAHANIFDTYGLGARGTAMGGAQGAAARDYSAVYYNPALLTMRKKTHLGFSLQLVAPSLEVDRPATSPTEADGGRDEVLPTKNVGLTAGVVFPLGGLIDDRIAIGVAVFVPTLNTTRLEAFDPTVPQFVLYQALPDQLVLSLAVAVEPIDGVRLGVGAQVLAALVGETTVHLDTAERRIRRRELRTEIASSIAPIVGLAYSPTPWLDLGLTWRAALALDYRLPIKFHFDDVGLLEILIEGTALYNPDNYNLGVAIHPGDFTIGLDLTYALWSNAPAPATSLDATLDDRYLFPDRSAPTALLDLSTNDFDPGFVDVFVPRIGVEYRLEPSWAFRGGYTFRPTPVPNQVGATNYLDSDAHQIGLGAGWRFEDPIGVLERPVTLELFSQITLLTEREVDKDPGRDAVGIGDYRAGGNILNVGLELHHDF